MVYTFFDVGCSMIRPFSADCSVKVPVYLSYGAEAAEKRRTKSKPVYSLELFYIGFVVL